LDGKSQIIRLVHDPFPHSNDKKLLGYDLPPAMRTSSAQRHSLLWSISTKLGTSAPSVQRSLKLS
jgi:hypothetical protein